MIELMILSYKNVIFGVIYNNIFLPSIRNTFTVSRG